MRATLLHGVALGALQNEDLLALGDVSHDEAGFKTGKLRIKLERYHLKEKALVTYKKRVFVSFKMADINKWEKGQILSKSILILRYLH